MLSLGAIIKNTNQYVYPVIANKHDKFECPECHRDLILRQGSKRVHHFAHYKTDNPCNYYTSPTESQIHKDAKQLMKKILNDNIKIVISRICRCCEEIEEFEIPERDNKSNIEIEYRFEYNGVKIADIAFIGNSEIVAIFEICNTHKTDKENRPEPWFEIDACALIKNANASQNTTLNIPCIRSELCDKCVEKNVCKGDGMCLHQEYDKYDNEFYIKNKDWKCSFNCIPIKCPTQYCKNISPKCLFDCWGGVCIDCDMGIEPVKEIEPIKTIYLDVPFSQNNEIKSLGAKFDFTQLKWSIKNNSIYKNFILSKFKEWKCPY